MRPRTILGLFLITVAGLALAWLFRTGGEPTAASRDVNDKTPTVASDHSRGRIVPLIVDEGFTGTAFIGAEASESSVQARRAGEGLVNVQPTIRRGPPEDYSTAPQLGVRFPHPLGLLGIGSATAETDANFSDAGEEALAPSPPTSHAIADGDTLAQLAKRYLGDASRAGEIYEANRDRLTSSELLPIGLEIALPQP